MDTSRIITIPKSWTKEDLQTRMFLPWGEVGAFHRLGYVIKEPYYRLRQIRLPRNDDIIPLHTAFDRARVRLLLIKRDGFYYFHVSGPTDFQGPALLTWCRLCGNPVMLGQSSIDHVIPRHRGGIDRFDNLWITHERCNHLKGETVHPRDRRKLHQTVKR